MYENKNWQPHLTVATVVEKDGKFLMVEEVSSNKLVINQPAGHIECNESIVSAAIRETLEETGYKVKPTHLLGLERWHKPHSQHTFFRYTLAASVVKHHRQLPLDSGIVRCLWLSYPEIIRHKIRLRSPMVESAIRSYLNNNLYPLSILAEHQH